MAQKSYWNPLETNLTKNRQKTPKKPCLLTRFLPPRSHMWPNLSETFLRTLLKWWRTRWYQKLITYVTCAACAREHTDTQTRRHEDGEFYILDYLIYLYNKASEGLQEKSFPWKVIPEKSYPENSYPLKIHTLKSHTSATRLQTRTKHWHSNGSCHF